MTTNQAVSELTRLRRGLREAVQAEAEALRGLERAIANLAPAGEVPPYGSGTYGEGVYGGAPADSIDGARAAYEDACRQTDAWAEAFARALNASRLAAPLELTTETAA